jgi:hypothetical protein
MKNYKNTVKALEPGCRCVYKYTVKLDIVQDADVV